MREISDRMDEIQKRSDWDQISKKIYEDNKTLIDDAIRKELENWENGNIYLSGVDAGLVEK